MNHSKEYSIDFNEITINSSDIVKIIGYQENSVPIMVQEKIVEVLVDVSNKCKMQGGYKIFGKAFIEKDSLFVEKVQFETKKVISNSLKNSTLIAVLFCTAGKDLSEWSGKLFKEKDSLKAYIADIAASVLAEKAADFIQNKIEIETKANFLKTTNRYSPGYCGWEVKEQHKLFSLMPDNFCGVSLNNDALMIPTKSVSAIIGIGKNVEKIAYQCDICDKTDCLIDYTKNYK